MLPKLKLLLLPIGIFLLAGTVFLIFSKDSSATEHCFPNPPTSEIQIITPEFCETVNGTITIKVITAPFINRINLKLWADGFAGVCEVIAFNLPPSKSEPTFNEFAKQWDSSAEIDFHKYFLQAEDANQLGSGSSHIQPISTNNGTTGTLCGDPDPPSEEPSPPPSEEASPPSDGSSQTSSSGSETTTQTTGSESKEDKKDGGDVEDAILEEEIAVTINAFDPDIFLSGGRVKITDIKNIESGDKKFLQFSGTAKPSSLVTLYIFSNAVLAVVKSDDQGNWSYTREEELSSGKHTAFATVYDGGVTRRSRVVEFFVAKTSSGGSLMFGSNNLQRFYPYATVLAGAIIFATLILYLYRIYSKRRPANI